jgi:hypothetical protein
MDSDGVDEKCWCHWVGIVQKWGSKYWAPPCSPQISTSTNSGTVMMHRSLHNLHNPVSLRAWQATLCMHTTVGEFFCVCTNGKRLVETSIWQRRGIQLVPHGFAIDGMERRHPRLSSWIVPPSLGKPLPSERMAPTCHVVPSLISVRFVELGLPVHQDHLKGDTAV